MVDLTTRGRKRGFCPVWATQRLAKVSKDATSMLLNRLVGGTFEDVDIKRALDLLSVAPDDKREVSQQLKTFDSGWFFAFGRAVSKERLLFKVGPVQTSHPKPGSSKHAAEPPEPSEKIRAMLGALADIPKIAEEKARTLEDYKRQIRDLKTELVQTKKAQPKLAAPAKPSGLDPAQLRQLNSDIDALQKKYNALKKETEGLMKIIAKVVALGFEDMAIKPEEVKAAFEAVAVQIGKLAEKKIQQRGVELESLKKDIKQVQLRLSKFLSIQEKAITVQVEVKHNKPFTVTPPVRVPRPQRALQTGDLSQYQSDVLNAQAQIVALGRSKVKIKMLAPLANKSYTSSSFKQSLRDLRDAGYLIFVDSDTVSLTDAGRAIAPEADPIQSPQEMLARCKSVVSVYDGKLLEALSQTYPEPVPFDTLANLSNVSPTSSSFKQSLRDLRDVGMAKFIGKDQARLAGWVMLEEDE
ncbi:MAG TPA: hypothetical protein VHA06_07030 [Candidatus Angelobacter sp.]|nr:hypothetical protein [Candidatus Angelobacter sp.]